MPGFMFPEAFALGWWFFIDEVVYAASLESPRVSITFVDWICGILSTLGMLIVNSIDKSRLGADDDAFTSSGVALRARFFLFVGFALMASGLSGSITILILKYVLPEVPNPEFYFGIAGVVQNAAIMFSSAALWLGQNTDDYQSDFAL